MTSFFSVVIPLYNKKNFIENTINSVLDQSLQEFEVIIVNDGSTDTSLEIVKQFKDPRISIISIDNSGVSKARNIGIEHARANYIAFLDADDFWKKNHLEKLYHLIKNNPLCGLYASAYAKKHNNLILKSKFLGIPDDKNWTGIVKDYFHSSLINSIAWSSSVAIPKKVLEEFNGFDENITLGAGEDTDLWIRIALKYKVAFSNTVTAIHNLDGDNRLSNTNTNKRNFLNLDKFDEDSKKNASLKRYIDFNRFSIGMRYRLANNNEKAKSYFCKIDYKNLNFKQRLLLKCNKEVLVILIKTQKLFRKLKINLSPFH